MTRASIARAVARKDLAVELGSRVVINQVAPFALVVMVMFAFALDNEGILQRVAPGLVWLATLFSMLVVVQRSFAVESADGALRITGERAQLDSLARQVVSRIRQAGDRPACVGVGVSTAEQVREVNTYADGAIVGTAFINAYEEGGLEALREKVIELASGLD